MKISEAKYAKPRQKMWKHIVLFPCFTSTGMFKWFITQFLYFGARFFSFSFSVPILIVSSLFFFCFMLSAQINIRGEVLWNKKKSSDKPIRKVKRISRILLFSLKKIYVLCKHGTQENVRVGNGKKWKSEANANGILIDVDWKQSIMIVAAILYGFDSQFSIQ